MDTRTELPTGEEIEGMEGLREYLVKDRRKDVVRQFCRKLLGYSLGREVQLSDEELRDYYGQETEAGRFVAPDERRASLEALLP